jgi:endonuclease/exonuclease/phosphatase family metal-dependent hydrolase
MHRLRVMTFNIAGAHDEEEGDNAWNARRAMLNVATIKHYAPDIIGFQEFQAGNQTTYATHLAHYEFVLGPHTEVEPYVYNAIYWNPASCELLQSGGFWLSLTPETYSGAWNTAAIRAATWACFRHRASATTFVHVNTHLDHISEQARQEGSVLILQRSQQLAQGVTPLLLTGDFNTNTWLPPQARHIPTTLTTASYAFFLEHGFCDAFRAAGNQDSLSSHTYHDYAGSAYDLRRHHLAWRIDWILIHDPVRKIATERRAIIQDHDEDIYPSDHYPVLADLILMPEGVPDAS